MILRQALTSHSLFPYNSQWPLEESHFTDEQTGTGGEGTISISDALTLPSEAALTVHLTLGRAWRTEDSRSQILREKHQGGTYLYS